MSVSATSLWYLGKLVLPRGRGVNVQILCKNNGERKLDILPRIWLKHPRLLISKSSLSRGKGAEKMRKKQLNKNYLINLGQLGVFATCRSAKKLLVKWHICVCYTLVCKAQMLHLEIIDCTRQSNVSYLWLSFGRIYQFVMRRETDTTFSLNHNDAVISSRWHLRKFIESGLKEIGPWCHPLYVSFLCLLWQNHMEIQ